METKDLDELLAGMSEDVSNLKSPQDKNWQFINDRPRPDLVKWLVKFLKWIRRQL